MVSPPCDENAFNTALAAVQTGGGALTFNCGTATITFTSQKTITGNVIIDGGNAITLSGGGATRHFVVNGGARLTLRQITLSGGAANGDGGSIYVGSGGALAVERSTLSNNHTTSNFSGGAIVNYGSLTITDSILANNDAGNGGAIFTRFAGSSTTITNSTLRNNTTTNTTNGWGGAILAWDGAPVTIQASVLEGNTAITGGAIYVFPAATVSLVGSTVQNNQASLTGLGGGMYVGGTATVQGGAIATNSAGAGGGVYVATGGQLTLDGSRLSGNTAGAPGGGSGGGIFSDGSLTMRRTAVVNNIVAGRLGYGGGFADGYTNRSASAVISNSTFSGNQAKTDGGGIYQAGGQVSLTNSTVSGNTSGSSGGGLEVEGSATAALRSLTFYGNAAPQGANLYYHGDGPSISAVNTVFAAPGSGPNCAAAGSYALISQGYNLDSDGSCGLVATGDRSNANPLLGPLASNGGAAQTHLPQPGSPTIDAIPTGVCGVSADQRGVARPQGPACDIGAVEVSLPPTATPTATPTRDSHGHRDAYPHAATDGHGHIHTNPHPHAHIDADRHCHADSRRSAVDTARRRPTGADQVHDLRAGQPAGAPTALRAGAGGDQTEHRCDHAGSDPGDSTCGWLRCPHGRRQTDLRQAACQEDLRFRRSGGRCALVACGQRRAHR